jgi:FkbM family methyltransferase
MHLGGELARAYLRHAPWKKGRGRAFRYLHDNVLSKHRSLLARTKFGDLMEVQTPDVIGSVIYTTGVWEPLITQYLYTHLRQGDIFIDVGANIGYYTLLAARLVGPRGSVYSIEASPTIYRKLAQNVARNRLQNTTLVDAAAAGEKGTLSIFQANEENLGHATTVESLAQKERMKLEGTVRADTLQNLVGADLLKARIIKVDVEGAELPVLEPLFSSLRDFRSDTEWLLELSSMHSAGGQEDVDKIFSAFVSAGHQAYVIENRYDWDFYLNPPRNAAFTPLSAPPREALCDVLMTRHEPSPLAPSCKP